MDKKLLNYLKQYKKTYITLDDIANIYKGGIEYNDFANNVKNIVCNGGFEPVNKAYFKQDYYN